ncbi:hypothetical protein BVI434_300012 [Burkholderia vietnamiensis]|nr:hypothetical protein BVI434_300012 [Burkholderia vietnamiensis]
MSTWPLAGQLTLAAAALTGGALSLAITLALNHRHRYAPLAVALTGIAGRAVAAAIAGDTRAFDLFAQLRHRRFPGGDAWRQPALELGMLYHRVRELF